VSAETTAKARYRWTHEWCLQKLQLKQDTDEHMIGV